jgi:hypothetical protein
MTSHLLVLLAPKLKDAFPGLSAVDDGLRSVLDHRFGDIPFLIDHELEVASLRVAARVQAPTGAGTECLIWCLTTSSEYWDVKIGLDPGGSLIVHADIEVQDDSVDPDAVAGTIRDRAETISGLLDRDLVDWLLSRGLGTPAQRTRWIARAPTD